MDTLVREARRFQEDAEALWEAHPERALRIVAAPEKRVELVKALRLWELSPQNRMPFFLLEGSILGTEQAFTAISAQVAADYQAVRAGAAVEGVALPAFGEVAGAAGPARAREAVMRVARLLSGPLAGIMLALLPRQIVAAETWKEIVAPWARGLASEHVRVAVLDADDALAAVLGPAVVRFAPARGDLVAGIARRVGAERDGRSALRR